MYKILVRNLLKVLSGSLLLLLFSCGSGGGQSSSEDSSLANFLTGNVINGPLSGATVNIGSSSYTTGSSASFALPRPDNHGEVITANGGSSTINNQPSLTTLKTIYLSSSNYLNINPYTTILANAYELAGRPSDVDDFVAEKSQLLKKFYAMSFPRDFITYESSNAKEVSDMIQSSYMFVESLRRTANTLETMQAISKELVGQELSSSENSLIAKMQAAQVQIILEASELQLITTTGSTTANYNSQSFVDALA